MLGDLVEIEKEKGKLWFWLSVCGVALSLFWRRPVAFFVALYVSAWVPSIFIREIIFHGKHDHPGDWLVKVVLYLEMVIGSLCGFSLYAAIRYGLRERTTQMAFVWTAICAVATYFWWQPIILEVCMAVAICIVVASMWTSKTRMESAVILVPVMMMFLCAQLWSSLSTLLQYYLYGIRWSPKETGKHPWLEGVGVIVSILSFWVAISAGSYLRDRLMRRQLLESSGEML